MMHLAAETSPVDVAWAAFDDAAIGLNRMYNTAALPGDAQADRRRRQDAAMEVACLWRVFLDLYVGHVPGDAA